MRRLRAPLRVTWDWDWPPVARSDVRDARRPPRALVATIGAELARARVLLLEVGYPDAAALLEGELAAALRGFEGALSLVLEPGVAGALPGGRPWETLAAAESWLDATPAGGPPLPEKLLPWPAVRYYLTSANVAAVAASLARAVEAGARVFSLPNLPLFGTTLRGARELAPRREHLREFADLIAPVLRARPEIDLRVHHYGLWGELRARDLRPAGEEAPGHAGCQAGAALAYIDPTGILYPCASLPVPLESVTDGALERAWAGSELTALREPLSLPPATCRGCAHEDTCRGGCRGWAHYLSGTWDAPGPDCIR